MHTDHAYTALAQQPTPGRKYFTFAEASRALPYIQRVADDIAMHYQRAVEVRQIIEQAGPHETLDELRNEYEQLMDQLNDLIDELRLVGVDLKDFERGLIDFPAWHDGREILLCWQRGEPAIIAWHELEAGFAGRQDVAALAQEEE